MLLFFPLFLTFFSWYISITLDFVAPIIFVFSVRFNCLPLFCLYFFPYLSLSIISYNFSLSQAKYQLIFPLLRKTDFCFYSSSSRAFYKIFFQTQRSVVESLLKTWEKEEKYWKYNKYGKFIFKKYFYLG